MKKMRVAIIGQGRSGRDIHGLYFKSASNDIVEVVAVVDELPERRERAKTEWPGCDIYADYKDLFGRKDIDLVVNATYSQYHYVVSKDLLEHDFNVLCEKPFGRNVFECRDLQRIANEHGKIVSAFHQSLYAPAYLKFKELVATGLIGDILQIDISYNGFARRWDWQTLQACCAGGLYNTAPHPIGMAFDLLGWDDNLRVVYSSLKCAMTSGDSDDYAKVILAAPGKPTVDIEVISSDAYATKNTFKAIGTKGTIVAGNDCHYSVKYIIPEELEPRPVTRKPICKEDGTPTYCSEKLISHEETGKVEGTAFDAGSNTYYHQIYDAVMLGKPLAITPKMAEKVIGIIETCHAQNPLPVKY